jgi:hypothetical protein
LWTARTAASARLGVKTFPFKVCLLLTTNSPSPPEGNSKVNWRIPIFRQDNRLAFFAFVTLIKLFKRYADSNSEEARGEELSL